jgi:hypothetical protein
MAHEEVLASDAHSGVRVCHDADCQCAEGLRDLRVALEAAAAEEVDEVAGESDDQHHGGLLPLGLVDDDQAHGEGWHEEEEPVIGHRALTCGGRGGVAIYPPVYDCSNRNAVTLQEC